MKPVDDLGYGLVEGLVPTDQVAKLLLEIPDLTASAGTRNLLESEWCQELAHAPGMVGLASSLLADSCHPVRAILFDKQVGHNWALGWHQDSKIAVNAIMPDLVGYKGWSEKEGVIHVEPPSEILAQIIALRVHLDRCDETNGPLMVLPGSHRLGRRSRPTQEEIAQKVVLTAMPGDVVWMRSLVFHGSPRAMQPGHRRVIHIEYASAKLPDGLQWAW